MKTAILYYFSGCGNTKKVSELFREELVSKDYSVELVDIETCSEFKSSDLSGFLFPIYGFGIPQLAVKFLKNIPSQQKQKAFIALTPAGHEGVGIIQSLAILKAKKFDVLLAQNIFMPDTWTLVCGCPSKEEYDENLVKAKEDVAKYVQDIANEKRNIKIANLFWLILLGLIYLLFYFVGRHQAGKCFCVGKNCTKCKKCVEICPSKTIKWKNDSPYWDWNCQQCYRCINICPTNCVEVSGLGMLITTLALFFAHKVYHFIPNSISSKLDLISPVPQIVTWLVVLFSMFWLTQFYLSQKNSVKFSATQKRKRYKI